ncbi:Dynein heavy chain [Amphibalanus amphitrite]|uniref:Dynein heavy chain n=1 Tax=Amphibalanus amphitrite TaxID=1232801 RepID=A0A6A4WWJ9_AMPAM|nr:Dynein heavy chain [Amphibalanus amphitrite]
MLDGVPPYLTLSPFTGARAASGSSLARRWSPGTPPAEAAAGSEAGLELHSFTARPDTALSVCPLTSSPSVPAAEPSGGRGVTKAGGGAAGGGDGRDTAARDGAGDGGDGAVGGGDGRDTTAGDGGDGAGDRTTGTGAKTVAAGRFRCTSLGTDCAGAAAAVAGLPSGLGPPGENGVSEGSGGLRTDPDGETATLRRSVSLTQMPVLLRFPTLEASRQESTPPGFAHVQLFLDRVLPEDRSWWRDAMSEPVGGALYLSSKKARQLMRDMFESLQLTVEQDRQSMSMVDRCLADYRGEPSYDKDVKSRGPAVTLRLTQTDDRAIANMPFFQNSCCHWLCICCSVILLLPFCVWIFLTGGSWPVRKCTGGACCSIYYTVTLLVPMVLVLPALLVVLALRRPEPDPAADAAAADQLHIGFVIAYVALSALCASLFVCVSQCFFKLPTIFYGDFVTALVCPEWPNDAMQFKTRSRQWPTRYEVDGIVRQGCHLVPKPPRPCRCLAVNGPAACDDAHLLWRYSFSKVRYSFSKVRYSFSKVRVYRYSFSNVRVYRYSFSKVRYSFSKVRVCRYSFSKVRYSFSKVRVCRYSFSKVRYSFSNVRMYRYSFSNVRVYRYSFSKVRYSFSKVRVCRYSFSKVRYSFSKVRVCRYSFSKVRYSFSNVRMYRYSFSNVRVYRYSLSKVRYSFSKVRVYRYSFSNVRLWCYSFSKAEVRLSQALPEHYRRAYMTFKWLVKKYVTRSSCPMYGIGSNMRSYYLKTVLFWELDLRGAVEWSEGVEEELLQRLARRTLRHIRQRHLPHFFIPDINLLDELTQTDFEMVADLMEKILAGPAALLNMPQLTWQMSTIGMCEAIFCTPGRDFQSDVCCNYASRMHTVW